jgi:mono/diheme cytochrome c family protein
MSTHEPKRKDEAPEQKVFGALAEFTDVDSLVAACEKVRDRGFRRFDAHTPFPVHGIEEAIGIRWTILPWIVLGAGLTGLALACAMQGWMNGIDYKFLVSGKPYFSIPAWIPICFELTVLLSAFGAFLGCLMLNLMPELYHPLFNSERFKRATNDRFFISIEARDAQFDAKETPKFLEGLGAASVETYLGDAKPRAIPIGFHYTMAVMTCLSFVPLAFIARGRFNVTTEPRIHLVWDMDWQKKVQAQNASPLFDDGRANRPPVAGTVAREQSPVETPFLTGMKPAAERNGDDMWIEDFPIALDQAALDRGEQRYNIYCAPCHGLDGAGGGMVALRADRLQQAGVTGGWVPPTNQHDETVVKQPVGQIFNTITHGIRNMPAYGAQIPAEDRWKIVAYMRALQKSRSADIQEVPDEIRNRLAGK